MDPAELRLMRGVMELYQVARNRGWVTASEHDRLRFVAAAIHANRIAGESGNPVGLLLNMVRRGEYLYLAEVDFDAAHKSLKNHGIVA